MQARLISPRQTLAGGLNKSKICAIEDGNVSRCLRNGAPCPATIGEWLLFYAQTDVSVFEVWLRSLREVARLDFGFQQDEPTRVCSRGTKSGEMWETAIQDDLSSDSSDSNEGAIVLHGNRRQIVLVAIIWQ